MPTIYSRGCRHLSTEEVDKYQLRCKTCGDTTIAVDPDYVDAAIGPQRVGGRYQYYGTGTIYTVIAIERRAFFPAIGWQITCLDDDGHVRHHSTPWDKRHRIICQPDGQADAPDGAHTRGESDVRIEPRSSSGGHGCTSVPRR